MRFRPGLFDNPYEDVPYDSEYPLYAVGYGLSY
jgi:hypothetical protein